ncbi:MAG: GNAT family N-acetyltransferase [Burkholderiales bacterium]
MTASIGKSEIVHSSPMVQATAADRPLSAPIGIVVRSRVRLSTEFCTSAPSDDEWQTITDALPPHSRFATAAWIRAWGESFLPYQDWKPPLRYVTVRSGAGRLLAFFPFATQRKFAISVAALGGFYWPFRCALIAEDCAPDVFEALASGFTRFASLRVLRYGPVPEGNPGIEGLNAALEMSGWRVHRSVLGETHSVDLPHEWDEFERGLGKSLRSNSKYYERKMRRDGALEIVCHRGGTGARWLQPLRDVAAIERKSWQMTSGGKPRFCGEAQQTFWSTLFADPRFESVARVWLMYFNGEPVSFCFCLDSGDTRHIVANCYAEHVHRYSTGTILYRHVLRDAIEGGTIRRVNMGLGDPGYKSRWGALPSFRLVDWTAFRPGPRGRLLEWAARLR